jgi:hypothetical protein
MVKEHPWIHFSRSQRLETVMYWQQSVMLVGGVLSIGKCAEIVFAMNRQLLDDISSNN